MPYNMEAFHGPKNQSYSFEIIVSDSRDSRVFVSKPSLFYVKGGQKKLLWEEEEKEEEEKLNSKVKQLL